MNEVTRYLRAQDIKKAVSLANDLEDDVTIIRLRAETGSLDISDLRGAISILNDLQRLVTRIEAFNETLPQSS